ncbi:hypothetical protein DUI87_11690 [Hirundo rustica rustica]|uniref:Uncharacterized protein n=1 Tax=Hirundo rustica rustica TaxID=333673 RepID=A0A3M0KKU8_HIRRU|nr:hypothetical protein DUI87_11690 [Hirundo rustica rustica]
MLDVVRLFWASYVRQMLEGRRSQYHGVRLTCWDECDMDKQFIPKILSGNIFSAKISPSQQSPNSQNLVHWQQFLTDVDPKIRVWSLESQKRICMLFTSTSFSCRASGREAEAYGKHKASTHLGLDWSYYKLNFVMIPIRKTFALSFPEGYPWETEWMQTEGGPSVPFLSKLAECSTALNVFPAQVSGSSGLKELEDLLFAYAITVSSQ